MRLRTLSRALLFLLVSLSLAHNTTYHFPIAKQLYSDDKDQRNDTLTETTPVPQFNKTLKDRSCHNIHEVSRRDQCQFSLDYCEGYSLGFINYINIYYCRTNIRSLLFVSYIAFLAILFTSLGLAASEFLCPNLDSISKIFKMSESLAGVTLLALGNGSPDLFGTLEAVKANSTSLAVSELIGAALFITCCVVGSMAIARPFKVAKRPFIRDVLFLLVGLSISVVTLKNGEITLFKAIIMIMLHVVYVLFVVIWDYIMVKRRRQKLLDQKIRNAYLNEEAQSLASNYTPFTIEEDNELNDDEILDSLRVINNGYDDSGFEFLNNRFNEQSFKSFQDWNNNSLRMFKLNHIRPSLLNAIGARNQLVDIDGHGDEISLNTLRTPSSSVNTHSIPIKMSSAPVFKDEDIDDFGNYESRVSSSAPAAFPSDGSRYRDDEFDQDDVIEPSTPTRGQTENLDSVQEPKFNNMNSFIEANVDFFKVLFPSLVGFSRCSILNKISLLVCLPFITILRLTIPVVETKIVPDSKVFKRTIDVGSIWTDNFLLLLLQCVVSPLVTTYLLFEVFSPFITSLLSIVLIGASIMIKSKFRSNSLSLTSYFATVFLSIIGFIVSINWISTIATELISLIKFFSILFNLSDSILGLTVFAVGNSLGDLISNFTVARMGFPMMAMSACFGGPLLNILLGIGISVNYVILSTDMKVITFEVSRTLVVSCFTLFINLIWLLVMVPLNKWEMNAKIGYIMIGFWGVATIICVILEIFS